MAAAISAAVFLREDNRMKLKPYSRRVYYYETDKMGIVHHSNYIRWFEEARVDLIEQAGLPFQLVEEEGLMTPVLSAECEYKLPFKFGDVFIIKAYIPDFGGARFSVTYEVYDEICRSTEGLYDE